MNKNEPRVCEKCGRSESEHTGPDDSIPEVCDGYRGFTDREV